MSEPAGQRQFAFTLDRYRELLESLRAAGYTFRSFGEPAEDSVILRHDVDLSTTAALRMAQVESSLGVTSTYHVLLSSPLYNPFEAVTRVRIKQLESLGHDVALHFSTHAYWDGEPADESALLDRVDAELTALDSLLSEDVAETVSFHIPPEWVLDRSFPGVHSAYEPRYFADIGYVADSGQRWREEPPRVDDLPSTVQLLVHPGLWGASDEGFEACVDRAIDEATTHVRDAAHREFIDGVYS